MEVWRKCTYECGKCEINVKDNPFLFVDPSDIIEWAHNALDYVDIHGTTLKGFPIQYFISCDNSIRIGDCIAPAFNNSYSISKDDILHYIVEDISHYMILHSKSRIYLNNTQKYKYPYCSISDIKEFRNFGMSTNSIRMIDALLDGINIKIK